MEHILEKIQAMTACELQEIMRAIEQRYAAVYPEWDMVYIALHKNLKIYCRP